MYQSLDQLLSLLPDNSTGEISAADLRAVVTGLWGRVIVGEVQSNGTLIGAPAGWTAEMLQGGLYRVIHNLGTADYAVQLTPMVKQITGYAPAVESHDEVSFTFGTYSVTNGGLHGVYTNFAVILK